MGGKQSVPVAPAPSTGTVAIPSMAPPTGPKTLKDVTLRSVVFGLKDVEVQKGSDGSMILASQVSQEQFDSYVHILKIMAQLSRLVYCDLSMIREVMLNPAFGTPDNKAVNDAITAADAKYSEMRKTPASGGINGRPMQSYVFPPATDKTTPILKYGASPSDVTCIILGGDQLKTKQPFFQDTDLIICFKGSSTVKNFKHDLYSQFTPADLSSFMPPGTTASSGTVGNVPASFVKPLVKSWDLLKKSILEKTPTRLFVTGHSLGGAYATMFSFIVAESRTVFPSIQTLHLVTFGCPTVLADTARNTFNSHLDSGFITLDRVTSSGVMSKLADVISSIPVGFSHPGFQPLRTELYPEKNTGRAYNLDKIRKVYQTGGLLGLGSEKNKYELATKTHMPTRIVIPAVTAAGNAFAHGEYFDMTWLNSMRIYGMKNPGFDGNTFVGYIYADGISWAYVPSDPTEVETPSATQGESASPPTDAPPSTGARRKTYRKNMKKSKTMRR